jgi:thiamine biosynthesis lipoprotein
MLNAFTEVAVLLNKFLKLQILVLLSVFLTLIPLCSCSSVKRYDETFFAMDTVVTFTVYQKYDGFSSLCNSLLTSAEKTLTECGGYMISASEDGQTVELTDTLASLVERSFFISELTEGDYDLSVAPLVAVWNIKNNTEPPSESDIERARSLVGYKNLDLEKNKLTFSFEGMGIDLGSVGKGWAGDAIVKELVLNGVDCGIVNLGGNIRVFGDNPKNESGQFSVGIKDPFDTQAIIGYVNVKNTNVITSGAYERFFEYNGEIYHHILDPKTGFPSKSDLASVTVICSDGAVADMLSTALFVVGEERGSQILKTVSELYPDVAAIFVSAGGEITTFNTQLYGTD